MNGGKGWGVQEHHLLRFFVQSSKFEAGGHRASVSVGMQVGGGGGRLKHSAQLTQPPQFNIDFTQWGEDKQMQPM